MYIYICRERERENIGPAGRPGVAGRQVQPDQGRARGNNVASHGDP